MKSFIKRINYNLNFLHQSASSIFGMKFAQKRIKNNKLKRVCGNHTKASLNVSKDTMFKNESNLLILRQRRRNKNAGKRNYDEKSGVRDGGNQFTGNCANDG